MSLTIKRGEIFGLLGPNGTVKTSLLSCIEDLYQPTQGQVQMAGMNMAEQRLDIQRRLGIQLRRTALIDASDTQGNRILSGPCEYP